VLPGLAGGEAGDTERVLGVPGICPHRGPGRSVARAASEPVLTAARRAGAGNAGGAAQAGYGERTSARGGRGGQRVLRGSQGLLGGGGTSAVAVVVRLAPVTGAAVVDVGAAGRGVQWRDGLALVIEGGRLDLLLRLARQVHLDPDTLLLPSARFTPEVLLVQTVSCSAFLHVGSWVVGFVSLSLLLLGAVSVVIPGVPVRVELHVSLSLNPSLLVIFGLLLP